MRASGLFVLFCFVCGFGRFVCLFVGWFVCLFVCLFCFVLGLCFFAVSFVSQVFVVSTVFAFIVRLLCVVGFAVGLFILW